MASAREGSIQVLPEAWSDDELKGYMKEVATGLGVTCDHCHVMDDLASDALPSKIAARKMMQMTQDLNASYMNGQGRIECITCHQGELQPTPKS